MVCGRLTTQNLTPERLYVVSVRAINAFGEGPQGEPSQPRWTLGRPSVAPEPPVCSSVGVQSVVVSWDAVVVDVRDVLPPTLPGFVE
jgi:hypothetical protein